MWHDVSILTNAAKLVARTFDKVCEKQGAQDSHGPKVCSCASHLPRQNQLRRCFLSLFFLWFVRACLVARAGDLQGAEHLYIIGAHQYPMDLAVTGEGNEPLAIVSEMSDQLATTGTSPATREDDLGAAGRMDIAGAYQSPVNLAVAGEGDDHVAIDFGGSAEENKALFECSWYVSTTCTVASVISL